MAIAREINQGQATVRIYRGLKRRSLIVKIVRIVLPLVILIAVGFWAGTNYFSAKLARQLGIVGDLIIELDPHKVTLVAPTVRGYMTNGTHYVLNAKSIKRGLVAGSPVEMHDVDIDLVYASGNRATISSDLAELSSDSSIVIAQEQLSYANSKGLRGEFGRTFINQRENTLRSYEPFVVVTANGSTVWGQSVEVDMDTRIWALEHVRMLLIPLDDEPEAETE